MFRFMRKLARVIMRVITKIIRTSPEGVVEVVILHSAVYLTDEIAKARAA